MMFSYILGKKMKILLMMINLKYNLQEIRW